MGVTKSGRLTAAEGGATTVTVALPPTLPIPVASATVARVYTVVAAGVTTRVAGLATMPSCTNPSLQLTRHGAVPVSTTCSVAAASRQIVVLPDNVAVAPAEIPTVLMFLPVALAASRRKRKSLSGPA